jgi:3-oxoacyl-[acyl-carrier-protein] synthase II
LDRVEPKWMLKYLPNMAACHISILHDCQGPSNSMTASDVAGLLAAGESYRILGRGQADLFLTGANDSKLSALGLARHSLTLPMTKRNDDPAGAVRPFDAGRDGTAIGEGACVIAMESLEHALMRGAKPRAEVVGFGASFDGARDGSGLMRAIRAALREATIDPEDIDHIVSNAAGFVEQDAWEARALNTVFGETVPVYAPKGAIGHMGAASGPVELAFAVMALERGVLPPTINCEQRDPSCPVYVHTTGTRPVSRPFSLKIGYTDLGQCAAMVLRRWEG